MRIVIQRRQFIPKIRIGLNILNSLLNTVISRSNVINVGFVFFQLLNTSYSWFYIMGSSNFSMSASAQNATFNVMNNVNKVIYF